MPYREQEYTRHQCTSAIKAAQNVLDSAGGSSSRHYWSGVLDMWEARLRELDREALKISDGMCPDAQPYGGDEYKCPQCGRIWARNEDRPSCDQERTEK